MWKRPEKPIAIHPSQLVLGLYIWLDMSWDEHPFLYHRFKIGDVGQIASLQALRCVGKLYYYEGKSTAVPGPVIAPAEIDGQTVEAPLAEAPINQEIERCKKEKHDRLRQQKDAAARADRAWEQAARATREAMIGMTRTPRQAGEQLAELSRNTASLIAQSQEVLLHLLGDKEGEGPQFHALNVMTLAMLLGKLAGLNETQLSELAMGALAHDIGKAGIPAHICKAKTRAKHEEAFYRQHGTLGLELAKASDAFGPTALSIITDHHEHLDGSGWPSGKKNPGPAARIVALVDRYDRLCTPESPEREALMPAEALARMFRVEAARFDPRLLSMLIKLLGVYPPGTLIKLNDESLGLVVSPGKESLRPTILIYSPEVDKRDAPTVDLGQTEALKIEEALRPSSIPADVLQWLNPRQRLSYYFSTDKSR